MTRANRAFGLVTLLVALLGACTAAPGGAAPRPPGASDHGSSPPGSSPPGSVAPRQSGPPATPGPALALDGHAYLSTSVTTAGADRPLVNGTRIRLDFEQGRLGASAGCNSMSAAYSVTGSTLALGPGAVTEMGCEAPRQDQDDWLFTLLGAGPTVTLDGDTLTVSSGTTTITLLDRKVAEPDRPLTGHRWALETIIQGDAASSLPAGVTASIEFTDDGRVRVDTGCNAGSGTYTVSAATMQILGLAMTKKACPGAADQVERSVLGVLGSDPLTFEIDASVLWLRAHESGLGYRD